jgi:ribosomal protein S6--L-glutamate ligase
MRFNNYMVEQKDNIKIVILTSHTEKGADEDTFYVVNRIVEECKKSNQECYVLFSEDSRIDTDKGGITRIYGLDYPDGVILDKNNTVVFARGNFIRTRACLDLLSQIELVGVFCVNSRLTVEQCAEKFRTTNCLLNCNIPTPKTALVSNVQGIDKAFKEVGGKFPVVLKTMTGSKGIGVSIVHDHAGLKSTLQTIWKLDDEEEMLIQEFIEIDYDIRSHVLGNEVIASMKRYKIKDDFRSNFSLGGKIEECELTDEQKDLAIRAQACVGGVWTGVDIMEGPKGSMIVEINSSPGTEGIEKATKESVVGMVLEYINNKNNWVKKTKEVGFAERIKIIGIGEMVAKMDTGNSNYCVIHAEDWNVEGDEITWIHHGKEYTHEIESWKEVTTGIIDKHDHKRPVIKLDVEFDGELFKDIRFTLADRSGPLGDVLVNRAFLRKANLVVNPAKRCPLDIDLKKSDTVDEAKDAVTGKNSLTGKSPIGNAVKKPDKKPPKKPSQQTIDWWNSHIKEEQEEHVKEYPNGDIAQLVKAGILKIGKKFGGGKSEEKPKTGIEKALTKEKEVSEPPPKEKMEVSGTVKTFSPEIEKKATALAPYIAKELDTVHHTGIPEKDTFGHKANVEMAKYVLDAIEKGERDMTVLANEVHRGWSNAVNQHYGENDIGNAPEQVKDDALKVEESGLLNKPIINTQQGTNTNGNKNGKNI